MAKKAKIMVKYDKLPILAAKLPEVVDTIVRETASDIEAEAKAQMSGPKHGRMYSARKAGAGARKAGAGAHQASAPGEAPAVDTGKLKNSIRARFPKRCRAVVNVAAEYGAALEFGTRKIAARPFMRPAAEKALPAFVEACKRLEEKLKV